MTRRVPPPWVKSKDPECWIRVSLFAKLVHRDRNTIYNWLSKGEMLAAFGYRAYQDAGGQWRIQVTKSDLEMLQNTASNS